MTTPSVGRAWRVAAGVAATILVAGCGGASGAAGVYADKGCAPCHGVDREGTSLGPALRLAKGANVELDDGSRVIYDADYVRRAIVDPAAELTYGWGDTMTTVALSDEQLDELVEWLLAP